MRLLYEALSVCLVEQCLDLTCNTNVNISFLKVVLEGLRKLLDVRKVDAFLAALHH